MSGGSVVNSSAGGGLPRADTTSLGDVRLPPGRPVEMAGAPLGSDSAGPLLWLSDDVVSGAGQRWVELRQSFASTGLWPVLLDWHPTGMIRLLADAGEAAGHLEGLGEGDRIELEQVASEVAEAELRSAWRMPDERFDWEVRSFEELRSPLATSNPGLAAAEGWPTRRGWPDDVAIAMPDQYIGVVPVGRPADVVAVMNWIRPVATGALRTMTALTAVMRSWEDRFGAVPVQFGRETLVLAVQRPPDTLDRALEVTAEHEAFCHDNLWQDPAVERYSDYARTILDGPLWRFWWD